MLVTVSFLYVKYKVSIISWNVQRFYGFLNNYFRETLRRVSTPQAYQFELLDSKYHEAFEKGIGIYGSHYTNTMMVELGVRLYFAAGSDKNIKLTTPDDLEMFKGYLRRK